MPRQDATKLRVLIVDDSSVYRRILSRVLAEIPQVENVGQVANGREALDWLASHHTDVILMDVEMPVMDGLMTLERIGKMGYPVKTIMVSGTSAENAQVTIQALEKGAFDFVCKPQESNSQVNTERLVHRLQPLFLIIHGRKSQTDTVVRPVLRQEKPRFKTDAESKAGPAIPTTLGNLPSVKSFSPAVPAAKTYVAPVVDRPERVLQKTAGRPASTPVLGEKGTVSVPVRRRVARSVSSEAAVGEDKKLYAGKPRYAGPVDIVCIGVSTGGPSALREVIPKLARDLPVPILLVQHMPPVFTKSLADSLSERSKVSVKEAEAGEMLRPGVVYIAPGGHHLTVTGMRKHGYRVRLTDAPPVHSCRPSVDVLFESVAETFNHNILSVVMTGMGCDGANGVAAIKRSAGELCYSIVQAFDTCVVPSMPQSVHRKGVADDLVPLGSIAEVINTVCLKVNHPVVGG